MKSRPQFCLISDSEAGKRYSSVLCKPCPVVRAQQWHLPDCSIGFCKNMFLQLRQARIACLICTCLAVASCSQTATSTYSGGRTATQSDMELRKKKILAARERARAKQAEKRAAFKASAKKRRPAAKPQKTAKLVTVKTTRSTKAYAASAGRPSGKISINAPWKCVPGRLKKVISDVRKRYGPVVVNSTHRSKRRNRIVGGKRKSYHLRCQAVDFRVKDSTKGLTRFLARHPHVGGYKRYRSGFYHIDTGPKRTW